MSHQLVHAKTPDLYATSQARRSESMVRAVIGSHRDQVSGRTTMAKRKEMDTKHCAEVKPAEFGP